MDLDPGNVTNRYVDFSNQLDCNVESDRWVGNFS
jgi:hypothetical protein